MRTSTTITTVMSMEPGLIDALRVETENGVYFLSLQIVNRAEISNILLKSMNEQLRIAIVYQEHSVVGAYLTSSDLIWKISDDRTDPNRMSVVFQLRQTPAYLNKQATDFDDIVKSLNTAKYSKTKYVVAINPNNHFIEAVKLLDG